MKDYIMKGAKAREICHQDRDMQKFVVCAYPSMPIANLLIFHVII